MLQNRTILITGGGSGIGEALALLLAVNNKVIICGRNKAKLEMVCSKNSNISCEVVDVSAADSIESLFVSLKQKNIVLNVLFNNAGVVELWDLKRQTFNSNEIFEKVNTNFSGAVAIIQKFISQANPSVSNLIINNTSEVAILPVPLLPLYSASKAGLSVFTKSLRVQLKSTSFKVVEILTPGVDTDMPRKLNNTGKLITPDVFAANVVRSIAKGDTEYAPGKNVFLFRFFQKFLPGVGLTLIDKLSRKQLVVK